MSARILDGRGIAQQIADDLQPRIARLRQRSVQPCAAVIVASGDAPGMMYARSIARRGASVGVEVRIVEFDPTVGTEGALAALRPHASSPAVHALLVQRPLPPGCDLAAIAEAIPLGKDVDCVHPYSFGLLAAGRPRFTPATAAAVLEILRASGFALSGSRVAVIGRSLVVGRPVAALLLAADATVTQCHSRTKDIAEVCRSSDAIVAALGKPHFIKATMVKPGATVIDVGTNVHGEKVVGDVDGGVKEVAGALTPVPGGVGPVTTTVFLRNVVTAAEQQSSLRR